MQEQTFERLGSNETIQVNVRVLCATNRNLEEAIAERTFREDLYHRLNVVTLQLPPLRDRREDIPPLVDYFLNRFARGLRLEKPPLSQEALDVLVNYSWPGNVRELEHVVQRLMIFTGGYTIQASDLPPGRDDQRSGTAGGARRAVGPMSSISPSPARIWIPTVASGPTKCSWKRWKSR